MAKRSMFVGMDVHKESIDVSLAEEGRDGEERHDGVSRRPRGGDATGVLVTNFHVVEGADSIQVTNHAGGTYKVTEIEAADEMRDVAVLQLGRVVGDDSSTLQGLPYMAIGESGQMNMGDKVFSIGSPKGFSGTLSDGLVSATRDVDGQAAHSSRPLVSVGRHCSQAIGFPKTGRTRSVRLRSPSTSQNSGGTKSPSCGRGAK